MKIVFLLILLASVLAHAKPTGFDSKLAAKYMREYQDACEKDDGQLWNHTLCVKILIVDPVNKIGFSNQPDPKNKFTKIGNFYSGEVYDLPYIANAPFAWKQQLWSMLVWQQIPTDSDQRIDLFIHEAWHSIQNRLSLPPTHAFAAHLDLRKARTLIRLEWEALQKAIIDKNNRIEHLENVLVFRKRRFHLYPSAQQQEKLMDAHEGLAAYTGAKFRTTSPSETAKAILVFSKEIPSYVRAASYITGPLYGMLFDEKSPDWKNTLNAEDVEFGSMLKEIYAIEKIISTELPAQEILDFYNFQKIDSSEKKRDINRKKKIDPILEKVFAPKSLVIEFSRANRSFNPQAIYALSASRIIYDDQYTLKSDWGELLASQGVLEEKAVTGSRLFIGPPQKISSEGASGDGWELKLSNGWIIEPIAKGYLGLKKKTD